MDMQPPEEAMDHWQALEALAIALPNCEGNDVGFALTASGQDVLAAATNAREKLATYRDRRDDLTIDFPDDRIDDARIADWTKARQDAAKKFWPFGRLARRSIDKQACEHFGVSTAPNLQRNLAVLADLQDQGRALRDVEKATSLPTMWRGRATDLPMFDAQIAAGAAVRAKFFSGSQRMRKMLRHCGRP
jgi:hypothetical protein